VNLAASNGLYLVLLLLSGIVVPLTSFPGFVQKVVIALPSGAMAQALHRILGQGLSPTGADWLALGYGHSSHRLSRRERSASTSSLEEPRYPSRVAT
jgi:hypothetical protein